MKIVWIAVLALICAVTPAAAQFDTGTIVGTVT